MSNEDPTLEALRRITELERRLDNAFDGIEAVEARAFRACEKLNDAVENVERRLEDEIHILKGDITDLERGLT